MNGKQLKNSILQWAIQGKLVPQDPNDEPASVLLDKIRQEKERLIKEKKIKRDKNASIIYRGEDNSYYEKILATGEVKCIDEEVPFEIPQGWEWCRLKHICSMQAGKNISANKIFSDKSDSHPYRCVGGNGLRGYTENFNSHGHYSIIGRQGALCGCVNIEKGKFYATEHAVVVDTYEILSPLFMYYFLTALNLNKYATATAQPGLAVSNVLEVMCPLPPLNEGMRIIEKLSLLIPLIENYNVIQEKQDILNDSIKEQLKKSVLQEAIHGKLVPQLVEEGTAQELLEQIKTEKQKLVKEGKLKKSALASSVIFRGDDNKYYELIDNSPVCIDEFLPFQIPETWTWCKVKDLLEIQTGASFKKEQVNANKKGIRILRGGNILPNKYIFKDDDVFVSEEFVNANTILKKNCIITPAVTSLENIGKMAVIEKDYNNVSAGGFVFIISPYIQDFNHSLLLAYFLQSPFLIEAMRGITKKSGAAFYNLGKERLKELYLPLPPMAEQSRIVGKINEVLSSIMSK